MAIAKFLNGITWHFKQVAQAVDRRIKVANANVIAEYLRINRQRRKFYMATATTEVETFASCTKDNYDR